MFLMSVYRRSSLGVQALAGKEVAEGGGDGGGSFFGKEVPAVDRFAGHVGGQVAPQRERAAIVVIPARQRSGRAPQGQYRAADAAARGPVGGVVITVDARGGAVFLADGMQVISVAECRGIGGADRGVEGAGGAAPCRAQRVADQGVRGRADQAFGQRLGLGQQRPGPERECEAIIGAVPPGRSPAQP